jgi:hypothetical protein
VDEVVRELEEKHPKDAKAQEKVFQERTGKSRATYYREKRKLFPR